MKRGSLFIVLLTAMLFLTVPVALAYTGVEGSVADVDGNPWAYGGTVSCVQNSTATLVGTGTVDADGTWFVFVGSPSSLTCTIDPAPGPAGDPPSYTCEVPGAGGGGVQVYPCGPGSTGTGPNAVSLVQFSGQGLPVGAGVVAVVGALVTSAALWLRRR